MIIAGLFGQMAGYKVLKGTLYMPSSVGMSLGTASHAMGIAASFGIRPPYGRICRLGLDAQRRVDGDIGAYLDSLIGRIAFRPSENSVKQEKMIWL